MNLRYLTLGMMLSVVVGAWAVSGGGIPSNYTSVSTGTFVGSVTGCTSTPTPTITYSILSQAAGKKGGWAVLDFPSGTITCTSNATTFTMTGLPATLQPASTCLNTGCGQSYNTTGFEDNSVTALAGCIEFLSAGGTLQFGLAAVTGSHLTCNSGGWTAALTKGIPGSMRIAYPLN